MTRMLGLFLSVAVALPASAASLNGLEFPDSLTYKTQKLVLNGLGPRLATIFSVKVYVAGLYIKEKNKDPKAILASKGPKVMWLKFNRDVSKDQLNDAWNDRIEACKKDCDKFKPGIETIKGWMRDIREKEELRFEADGTKLTTLVNGEKKGEVDIEGFASFFFGIWLGDDPPNSSLKKGLLGNKI